MRFVRSSRALSTRACAALSVAIVCCASNSASAARSHRAASAAWSTALPSIQKGGTERSTATVEPPPTLVQISHLPSFTGAWRVPCEPGTVSHPPSTTANSVPATATVPSLSATSPSLRLAKSGSSVSTASTGPSVPSLPPSRAPRSWRNGSSRSAPTATSSPAVAAAPERTTSPRMTLLGGAPGSAAGSRTCRQARPALPTPPSSAAAVCPMRTRTALTVVRRRVSRNPILRSPLSPPSSS